MTDLLLLLCGGAAGAALAALARLPMWPLLGSIMGATFVHLFVIGQSLIVPAAWPILVQILVGAVVGSGVTRGVLRDFGQVFLAGGIAVCSIITVGIAGGFLVARIGNVREVDAILGTVPGGVGEMIAAADGLGADTALVAGMHVFRLVVVLLAVPLMVSAGLAVERWVGPRNEGGD